MGCHNECATQALSAEAEEVHQVILSYAVVGHGGCGLTSNHHLESCVSQFRKRINDKDAINTEGVDRPKLFPTAIVRKIRTSLKDFVESIVVTATISINHLGDGFIRELADVIGRFEKLVERKWLGEGGVVVEVGRNFKVTIAPVSEESFETVLGEQGEDFGIVLGSPLD